MPPWTLPIPVASGAVTAYVAHLGAEVDGDAALAQARQHGLAGEGLGPAEQPRSRTTSVTSEPSADIQIAASQATTPPPTTTSRSGTSTTPVASREPHGRASAYIVGHDAARCRWR